jgi:predicted SAM-dependent methyltransferase
MRVIKKFLPVWIKIILRQLVKTVKYNWRRIEIAQAVKKQIPLKIIIGAAETWQVGWYSTNEQWLNIKDSQDWENVFGSRKVLINVVAEHVFEHLSYEECKSALSNIHRYMLPHGRVRIAVPDGNNPDKGYIKQVGIAGLGPDAADHKQLLTASILFELFNDSGFTPKLIEGYTSAGELVQKTWSEQDGFILRSRNNIDNSIWEFKDAQTSLIVDGVINGK